MNCSLLSAHIKRFLKGCLLIILAGLAPFLAIGQDTPKNRIEIRPTVGMTARTTPARWGFDNSNNNQLISLTQGPMTPYEREANLQGFAINAGIEISKGIIGFEYFPSFRYDEIRGPDMIFRRNLPGALRSPVEGFIIDHNFNLAVKKKIRYGIGISRINAHTSYEYVHLNTGNLLTHNIAFTTYSLFLTIPIEQVIQLEIRPQYSPNGIPSEADIHALMFSARAYYRFGSLF